MLQRQPRTWWQRLLRRPVPLLSYLVVAAVLLLCLLAPVIAPYDPTQQGVGERLLPIGSPGHLLGTDTFGRDQFSRVLYGAQPLVITALLSVALAVVVGALLGLVAGYAGRWVDALVARSMDVLLSFPLILLAIMIVAALGPGLLNLIIAVAVSQLPVFARLTRALAAREAAREYVLAARAGGFPTPRILFREIAPNLVGPVTVQAASAVAAAATYAAALSFLGIGIQPPTPDWGYMVQEAQEFLFIAPDLAIIPGLLIAVFVTAVNFAGDDLRDVLDPGGRLRAAGGRR